MEAVAGGGQRVRLLLPESGDSVQRAGVRGVVLPGFAHRCRAVQVPGASGFDSESGGQSRGLCVGAVRGKYSRGIRSDGGKGLHPPEGNEGESPPLDTAGIR